MVFSIFSERGLGTRLVTKLDSSNKIHSTREYHKNILLLQQLSQLHVCGVHIMKFKDCFQSSEDLEIKTLRSFSLINL